MATRDAEDDNPEIAVPSGAAFIIIDTTIPVVKVDKTFRTIKNRI